MQAVCPTANGCPTIFDSASEEFDCRWLAAYTIGCLFARRWPTHIQALTCIALDNLRQDKHHGERQHYDRRPITMEKTAWVQTRSLY
jgi:hypothetical protein